MMRVEAYNQVQQIYHNAKTEKSRKTEKIQTSDHLEISSTGKDYQAAKQAVSAAPDTREELIAPLREGIRSGTYQVSGDKVAEKLVDNFEEMGQFQWRA